MRKPNVFKGPGYHVTYTEKDSSMIGPSRKTVTATVTTKSGQIKYEHTSRSWGDNYKNVDPKVIGRVWIDAGVDLKLP